MMSDTIEYFNDSQIQHGSENNRVYLMKLGEIDNEKLIDHLEFLAEEYNYTKIFTKVPVSCKKTFINHGYKEEAFIPKFFKGEEDCYFLVKYLDKNRAKLTDKEEIESVILASLAKKNTNNEINLPEGFKFQELNLIDAEEVAALYSEVFESYPFPIFDPDYILKTMPENIIYFGIKKDKKLVALSSAEIDYENKTAEMTDFATRKDYRGNNFSLYLLQKMKEKMQKIGIKTIYTIARSLSHGINITFARDNYEFGGTLINNTNIYGKIESMNVWYKNI